MKRIIKYVSGILEFGIWYPCDITIYMVEYFDSDYVGYNDEEYFKWVLLFRELFDFFAQYEVEFCVPFNG